MLSAIINEFIIDGRSSENTSLLNMHSIYFKSSGKNVDLAFPSLYDKIHENDMNKVNINVTHKSIMCKKTPYCLVKYFTLNWVLGGAVNVNILTCANKIISILIINIISTT